METTAGPAWIVTSGEPDPATVERLLRSLPEWFGIESAVAEYVETARHRPAYLAWPSVSTAGQAERRPVGVLLATRHFPCSAEIHLLAADRSLHRRGIGRALVEALVADLIRGGVELLQVKTLGPARPDAGYERTRRFYRRLGFQPLEEIHGLWPENPCLIMVKVLGRPGGQPLHADCL
ncbi:MAG TPA: GNAT family N-acetyltransferase [Streptosporangiaceae bacterium]|nr:GNAT family N-acetyltransferase [Streptosporangiaceae bacterium]